MAASAGGAVARRRGRGVGSGHLALLIALLLASTVGCRAEADAGPMRAGALRGPLASDGVVSPGDADAGRAAEADVVTAGGGTGRHLSQADLEEAKSKLQHMIGNHGDAQKKLRVERRADASETAALEARLGGDPSQPRFGRKHRHKHHEPQQAEVNQQQGVGGGGGVEGGALDVGALEYAALHGGNAAAILNQGHPTPLPRPATAAAPPPSPRPAPTPEPELEEDNDTPEPTKPPKVQFVLPESPKDVENLVVKGMDAYLMMQELEAARKEILKMKGKIHGQQRENKMMRKELNKVESATSQVMTAAVVAHNTAITCGCPVKYDVPDVGTVSTSDITNMLVDAGDSFKGRLLQSLVDAGSTLKVDGKPLHPDAVKTFLPVVMASSSKSKSDAAADHLEELRKGATTLFRGLVPRIKDLLMWSSTPGVETGKVERKKTCALVGNGQRMLLQKDLGEEINRHDAVLRLNQAPTLGFEQWVGNFTTWRLINAHWAYNYRKKGKLALEANCTVMVSRTQPREYVMTARALKKRQPSVGTVLMERRATDGAGDFLRALKSRLDMIRGFPYAGKGSPSSGFLGTWLLMQLCDQVDVYGVGIGQGTSWHYFHQGNFVSSREFSDAPHHSFEFETAVLRMLDAAGLINHRLPTEFELTEGESAKEALLVAMEGAMESSGLARKAEKKRLKEAEDGEASSNEPELEEDLSGEAPGRRRKYGTGQGRLIAGGERMPGAAMGGRGRHLLSRGGGGRRRS